MRERTGKPRGRPQAKSTLLAQQMREMLVATVHKNFKPMLDAQMDLAKGIAVQKTTIINGKPFVKVYEVEANHKAFEYLTSQSIGKPKETVEIQGEVKSIIEVVTDLTDDGD